MTRHLEEQARGLGRTAVLVAAFEHERRFTTEVRERYAELGAELAFCAIVGRDVPPIPRRASTAAAPSRRPTRRAANGPSRSSRRISPPR